jgi:hypothetical protein
MKKETALQQFIGTITKSGIVLINQTLIDNCLILEQRQRREDTNYGYLQGYDDGVEKKEPMKPHIKSK